jgi:hypothetical protein
MSQTTTNSITQRAMLVSLRISKWAARKHDKQVSKEVAIQHGLADVNLGKYSKQLLAKKALEKLNTIASQARTLHYTMTLPWSDEGYRLLTSTNFTEYCEKMRQLKEEWRVELALFLQVYPQYKAEAKQALNGLFNEEDYPSESKIESKFDLDFNVLPMPTGKDFRVQGIIDEEVERVKRAIEANTSKAIEEAMKDPFKRIRDVVERMVERLKLFKVEVDEDGTKTTTNPFRDTLVSNITDVLDMIPGLNLTGDKELDRFCTEVRKTLTKYTADDLREHPQVREKVLESAEQILSKMAEFI